MKSSIIGIVAPPEKTLPVPSNCKVTQEGNKIVLTDDTASRPFILKHEFSTIMNNFPDVMDKVTSNDNLRIISLGSEYSTPTITQIKEWSIQLLNQRLKGKANSPTQISAGLVYDKDVLDFMSLTNKKTPCFELVDVDDLNSAIDLIDFSFEKFKRFKESVYVLHIGSDPFFEWIVVPRVDSFDQRPSLTGLPPNEKLIFILKQFPTLSEQGISTSLNRFRNISNIFRLVLDTFLDVKTLWVCHIAKDVKLKSNAALFRIAGYISEINTDFRDVQIDRSGLFQLKSNEEEEIDFNGLNPEIFEQSIRMTEEQRQEAEAEEEMLKQMLSMKTTNEEADDETGEFSSRSEKNQKFTVRNKFNTFDSEDDQIHSNSQMTKKTVKKVKKVKKKQGSTKKGYQDEDDENEDNGQINDIESSPITENPDEARQGKREHRHKNKKQAKKKNPPKEVEVDESVKKAEEEARARKHAEEEARAQKIQELLNSRNKAKKKDEKDEKKSKNTKRRNDHTFSQTSSLMSQRNRINMMMQKFKNQKALDSDYSDYSEEEEDDNDEIDESKIMTFSTRGMTEHEIKQEKQRRLKKLREMKRKQQNSKKRQYESELLRLQMLAIKAIDMARKAAPPTDDTMEYNDDITNTDLYKKDSEIIGELNKVEEYRKLREAELISINKKLHDKRRKHEKYEETIKERRALYIDIHNSNIQMKSEMPPPKVEPSEMTEDGEMKTTSSRDRAVARRKVYDHSRSKLHQNSPEYLQTKMLLEKEIAKVKRDIQLIKRRPKQE